VRMSIANYENLISNAERRAVRSGEATTIARPTDLAYAAASARGKLELAMTEESGEEDRLIERLVEEAIKVVFDQHFKPQQFQAVVDHFESGNRMELIENASSTEVLKQLDSIKGFRKVLERAAAELSPSGAPQGQEDALLVAVAELILDGLYAHNRINK